MLGKMASIAPHKRPEISTSSCGVDFSPEDCAADIPSALLSLSTELFVQRSENSPGFGCFLVMATENRGIAQQVCYRIRWCIDSIQGWEIRWGFYVQRAKGTTSFEEARWLADILLWILSPRISLPPHSVQLKVPARIRPPCWTTSE